MKNKNTKTEYPIPQLREQLRQEAGSITQRLGRSVARLTSCDELPCPEYGEVVQHQMALAQRLFYLQHCRTALEKCIVSKSVTLRYRWSDGTVSRTVFRKCGPNRVRVTGLIPEAA